MSLLTSFQNVCNTIGFPEPTSVVGSTDRTTKQMLATLYKVGDEMRRNYLWPELIKEHTATLTTDTASYALPADFEKMIPETNWNRSEQFEMLGPLNAQEWQWRVSGIIAQGPRQRFRVKGYASAQYFISPTPGSGDAGKTFVFEYLSKMWFLPVTWTTGAVFTANSYTSYNGNVYSTVTGGTTGATPPTHTSSSASDGGVTWVYTSTPYAAFTSDNDQFIFNDNLVELGLEYMFCEKKGLPYLDRRRRFFDAMKQRASDKKSARTLRMSGAHTYPFGSILNVPETGYGS